MPGGGSSASELQLTMGDRTMESKTMDESVGAVGGDATVCV